jgi:RNA polymerase sigma factor (sigma-70 family)
MREGSRFAGSQPNIGTELADCASKLSNYPEPFQKLQEDELVIGLRNALSKLPPLESQVFCLRCLNNMSYRGIAKELCIKTTTVGVLLHRARAKLRDMLEKAAVT